MLARHCATGGGAIAEHANDAAAQAFMAGNFFFRHAWTIFDVLIIVSWLLPPGISLYFKRRRERAHRTANSILNNSTP